MLVFNIPAPVISEEILKFLRTSFPDRPPHNAECAGCPEYNPYYRAGIEAVINHLTLHYQSQQEN